MWFTLAACGVCDAFTCSVCDAALYCFLKTAKRKIGLLEENSTTALDQINHRKLSILGDVLTRSGNVCFIICLMWL